MRANVTSAPIHKNVRDISSRGIIDSLFLFRQ